MPNGYFSFVQIVAYGVVGSCVAVLVGGNAAVITTAGAIGLMIGTLFFVLSHRNYPTHLINVIVPIRTARTK